MHRIFIDGQAGTTGLQIRELLQSREDIELLTIDPDARKDNRARQTLMESADVVILCLPDDAAREAVTLSDTARFIDASTAHRVNSDWTYGMPELSENQRSHIAGARHVSNPGCYPTGFLAALKPLVDSGRVRQDALLTISAISGYSGGGRQMIEKYEARTESHPDALWPVRPYALQMTHKHIPEMRHYSGLETAPAFLPHVGHFHKGMLVSVALFRDQLTEAMTPESVVDLLQTRYENEPCINVMEAGHEDLLEDGFLDPRGANDTNRLDLFTYGHADQILLIARLDNLGKGAAGAAVQNLNLMLQVPELEGLTL
jgi:N-acetyl-gamma-glutamyl-phosphate reductase